eukprot:190229_1
MSDSVANVMVSIVDSQVKNRDLKYTKQHQEVPSESNQKMMKYNRDALIDDTKEYKLIKSALNIAFEDNTNWNLDNKNANIQHKMCQSTQRKVFRILCNEVNTCDFMDLYRYLECGYQGVADFDIVQHIDNDHDMLYQSIKSPVSEWVIGSRDCQCVRMRYYIPRCVDKSTNKSYVVMGTLWYPFDDEWSNHALYIVPPKSVRRIRFRFGARVFYKPCDAKHDAFAYCGIQHAYRSGGWVPSFVEDAFGLSQKNIRYFHDLCLRIPEELKQRKLNINPKVQKPLLPGDHNEMEEKEMINENYEEIRMWLKGEANMEQYVGVLIRNGFDDFILIQTLTLELLETIGIHKIGHRMQIMKLIQNLDDNAFDDEGYVGNEEGVETQYVM